MVELLYKELTFAVIGAAMEVHGILGPGYLEAVYQRALAHEFKLRGIVFVEQIPLPVMYKDVLMGDYRADFVVNSTIILEIKSVSKLNPSHQAQAVHYLTSTGHKLALLLNFGAGSLEHRRIIKSH
jgi:GxxExxY protein